MMDAKEIKVKIEKIGKLAKRIEEEEAMIWVEAADCAREIQELVLEILAEEVRVFDNGGTSFDRYTVLADGDVYTMSSHPLSPQGVNQWAGRCIGSVALLEPGVRRDFGARLRPDQIPPEVREAIKIRMERQCKRLHRRTASEGS